MKPRKKSDVTVTHFELARLRADLAHARMVGGLNQEEQCAGCVERRKVEGLREELIKVTGAVERGREAYEKLFALYQGMEGELATYRSAAEGKPLASPPTCRKLPDERVSDTWHVRIADKETGVSPHVHFGLYPEGGVGELFILLDDRDKDRIGAMADAAAMAFSKAVQWGCPVGELAQKWLGLHGGVHGPVWTLAEPPPELSEAQARRYVAPLKRDLEVWSCTSLLDCVARRLLVRYCGHTPFSIEGTHWEKVGDEGAWRWVEGRP